MTRRRAVTEESERPTPKAPGPKWPAPRQPARPCGGCGRIVNRLAIYATDGGPRCLACVSQS